MYQVANKQVIIYFHCEKKIFHEKLLQNLLFSFDIQLEEAHFSLIFLKLLITLATKKKILRIYFQYSGSFSPAEYENESHFFPSRPDFPKLCDKGLKIKEKGCLQVVFIQKLTNKENVLHT